MHSSSAVHRLRPAPATIVQALKLQHAEVRHVLAGVSYWAGRPRVQRFVSDWLSIQRSHLREWVAGVHFDPQDIYQRRSDQVMACSLCVCEPVCMLASSSVRTSPLLSQAGEEEAPVLSEPVHAHAASLHPAAPLDSVGCMQVTFNKYAVPHMLNNYPGDQPYVRISALDQQVALPGPAHHASLAAVASESSQHGNSEGLLAPVPTLGQQVC